MKFCTRLVDGVYPLLSFYVYTSLAQTVEVTVTSTAIFTDIVTAANTGTTTLFCEGLGLPLCNQDLFSFISTTTTTSGSAVATPSSFILSGSGQLQNFLFQFADEGEVLSGRVVLAEIVRYRLVALNFAPDSRRKRGTNNFLKSFISRDEGESVLVNADDNPEIVYLRRNETWVAFLRELGEPENVLELIREVRHGTKDELLSDDIYTDWLWNATTSTPDLVASDGQTYRFYASAALLNSTDVFGLYMLPENVTIFGTSSFARVDFQDQSSEEYPSCVINAVVTDTICASTSVTDIATSSADSGSSSDASSDFPATSTQENIASTSVSTSGTSALSASPVSTSIISTSSSPSTSVSASASISGSASISITASASASTTPSGSSGAQTTTSASLTVLDAYDVITRFSLQGFCTTLLSYFPPVTVVQVPSTIVNTVTNVPETVVVTTVYTATTVITSGTSYSAFVIPAASSSATMRRKDEVPAAMVTPSIEYIDIEGRDLDTPSQLSSFASAAITSGCRRAATSPTAQVTSYITSGISVQVSNNVLTGVTRTSTVTASAAYVASTIPAEVIGYPGQGYLRWTGATQANLTQFNGARFGSYIQDGQVSATYAMLWTTANGNYIANRFSLQVVNATARTPEYCYIFITISGTKYWYSLQTLAGRQSAGFRGYQLVLVPVNTAGRVPAAFNYTPRAPWQFTPYSEFMGENLTWWTYSDQVYLGPSNMMELAINASIQDRDSLYQLNGITAYLSNNYLPSQP